LALTLGYGYSFSWGFIAFLAGAPLVLLLLSRAVSPKDAAHPEHDPGRSTDGPDRRTSLGPDRSRAVGTLVLSSLLLMTHALLHAFALVIALPFVLRRPGTARERLLRVLPWVAPLPLGLVWAAWTWWVEPVAAEPPRLDIGWFRVPWALLSLTGQPVGTPGFVLGSAFLLAPLLLAGKLRTGWLRWWPALVTVALVLVGPSVLLGCAWLPGRWTAFLVPLLLFAVDPPAPGSRRSRGSLPACLLLAGSHLSFEVPSLLAFERDAEEFEPVLSVMAPGRRVLSIPLLAGTEWNPGAPFLHHPQWYAVEKGGIVDFSFASYYVLLVRYRREVGEVLAAGFPWHPEQFIEKARSLGPFDYYVVRAAEDPTHRLFPRGDVRLLLRSGRYFLYRPGAP
jgi:hypothetical protein